MHFLSSLFKIVIIDLVLSGDNAVVIGMAAHRLPYRQRKIAIVCGGAAAIGLRITLTAGIGRYFTAKTALEIDFGPTLISGDYAAFSLVPGVVYQFSPHAYLAARFPITVDPDTAVYAAPGFGLSHTFKNNLTPTLELNGVTRLDENRGDLAVSVTLGLMYSF